MLIIDFLNFVSVENGRLSPAMNGSAENEPTTPGNKQGIGEGEIKMDMDVFRQVRSDERSRFYWFC